jgi:glycosyltransferase involved in cell wall biosynthesis
MQARQIEIVVPVHDEQAALEPSIRRLHRFLTAELPFTWSVVIADNASTDATPQIARRLARELPGVRLLRLEEKGRGRAVRAAWSAPAARVVAYMDVDLSTTCGRCCRSWRRCCRGIRTWPSAPGWRAGRASSAAPSAS